MTLPAVPVIIASLPSSSLAEARRDIGVAAEAGADVAEVRFDRWSVEERRRTADLFPSPLPLLATLRSTAEGGGGPDDAGARRAWREQVLSLPFAWIDLEFDRDLAGPFPSEGAVTWVVSSHLPAGTSAASVHARLDAGSPVPSIAKVVVPETVGETLGSLLSDLPPAGASRRIVLTTGPSGPLLRAWSRRLGFAAVYGSLPRSAGGAPPVEASQIPVDRLRRYLPHEPSPPLFAVIGRPVAHSRSPDLHHYWMEAEGRRGLYIALEFQSESELADAIGPLVRGGFRGLNVTHPFKEAALRLSTRAGPGAEACGCANTLTFTDGEIEAENTDLLAILRRLEDLKRGGRWDGHDLVVAGTGGAARATLAAARSLGVHATVLGRHVERTQQLADAFSATAGDAAHAAPTSVLVHATPVGRRGAGPLHVPLGPWLGERTHLLDFVYRAEDPTVPDLARRHGASYEDGRRLLGYAAAASFEIWWGTSPSPTLIDAAVREVG
ncbi:MAG: type I 3-dehydroquinate dehydratase [Thermoplasmata archaeon]|nr:type I 3-dehydroquinate dehydratase [Thermoplasmata archaeon]MCI4354844.1 type I 3-dehydroquinate dehydratase [Thermoplasmata archaeon]